MWPVATLFAWVTNAGEISSTGALSDFRILFLCKFSTNMHARSTNTNVLELIGFLLLFFIFLYVYSCISMCICDFDMHEFMMYNVHERRSY